jgi:pimeloyl-ACP methyl ester carboxylesterase
VPYAELDGIRTRYEEVGAGPPLLMVSPGGFDSSLDSWRDLGRYRELGLVDALSRRYTCILFDRRESGRSSGRAERLSWSAYVAQAVALLDHLGVESAHAMGGCVGCSTVAALAVARPSRVRSMVLFSPAGGVHYRLSQHQRFTRHLAFVAEHGLAAVVELTRMSADGFTKDPRVGPWAAALRSDEAFAREYAALDPVAYERMVTGTARLMFDRDTVPGPEPEDLLTLATPVLIVPGQDRSHATSAARYLEECLPNHDYWDVPVAEQTADNVPARILDFLDEH